MHEPPEPASEHARARSEAAIEGHRPKLVYVMGAGHSGSTILGITLGNCENIFFAGEIARWFRWAGKPPRRGSEREQFWTAIRAEVPIGLSGPEARSIDQSSRAFAIAGRRDRRRLAERYRAVTEALCRAIEGATGATHIVDTSHFPRRARQLQMLPGIELYLLFLVRDPRSVVASYKGDEVATWPRRVTATTNAYLWLTHLLSLAVFLRHPREKRLFVRHEDFVQDPEGVLGEILACIGSAAAIPDLTALQTGVAFQGNRLIRSDVIALHSRPAQPPRGSRVTALLQLPWRAVFAALRPAARASTVPDAEREVVSRV
ncbi:MAG TPA: sulfotransferase [Solirubrobacteraceae bacterium]|nr:sulfotransferase [Solirubrobacteraceae bacterium]